MVKSTVNLFAMVLGVLVLLPLAACERAQGATETAAEAAREAVGEAMEDAEEESEEATDELVEVQGRFVDKGDGTVRDNKTGLIWLRNANCAAPGPGSWDEAMAAAVALRDKPPGQSDACGLSDGSKAGDWRLPTIKEFCSAWSGEKLEPCPSSAASNSLLDSSLSGAPYVPNAAGTGLWTEGDPFVGLQPWGYWSATEHDATSAWGVGLDSAGVAIGAEDGSTAYAWPVRSVP